MFTDEQAKLVAIYAAMHAARVSAAILDNNELLTVTAASIRDSFLQAGGTEEDLEQIEAKSLALAVEELGKL